MPLMDNKPREPHKKIKVVLDTNSINNSSLNNGLFGNRRPLEEIIDIISIFVPRIVIEEIKEHKRRTINDGKAAIKKGNFYGLFDISIDAINKIDATGLIEDDLRKETLPYNVIDILDAKAFLEQYIPLAIRNKPPFQVNDDKGIKDALVAASVEGLLMSCSDDKILLVTGDSRLGEYFKDHDRVIVIKNISDIKKNIERDEGIVTETDKGRDIRFVGIREDSRQRKSINELLTNFRNSPNFKKTHDFVSQLVGQRNRLDIYDKKDIIESALNNDQIRWIVNDADIKPFLLEVFEECKEKLDEKSIRDFESIIKQPDQDLKDMEKFLDSIF